MAVTVRTAWALLGITLVLAVAVDFCSHVFVSLKKGHWQDVDWRVKADAYHKAPWVWDYWQELRRVQAMWVPYVYWREKPFHGRFTNIEDSGIRHTVNPIKPGGAKIRVFMFGGSTLWGLGERDQGTIASCLSRLLCARLKQQIEVTNFGEIGYVSNQELSALYRELQKGNKPDYVVFFDGFNEAYSAYQNLAPGIPINEPNREKGFYLVAEKKPGAYLKEFFLTWAANSSTFRIIKYLRKVAGSRRVPLTRELAKQAVDLYAYNVKVFEKLGEWKGFEPLFYWQPALYDKPRRTAYEEGQYRDDLVFSPFYDQVVREMKASKVLADDPRFRDLTGIFAGESQPIFLDNCHLSEFGSEAVARKIAQDLVPLIERRDKGFSRSQNE